LTPLHVILSASAPQMQVAAFRVPSDVLHCGVSRQRCAMLAVEAKQYWSFVHIGPAPEVAVGPHMHLALLSINPLRFTHWFGSLHFLFASGSASWQNLFDPHVGPPKPHLQLGVFLSTPFVF
jgi:hypothetical protein